MPRLLIPTRNRPTSLDRVLTYLGDFYPGASVILADGSHARHAAQNEGHARRHQGRLTIDYRAFPEDLHFYDRMLAVLTAESDPLFLIGSDDDFPMLEIFDDLERFLQANPDYSCAMGATVRLHLGQDGLTAHLRPVRPIEEPGVRERAFAYCAWPFATTFALTRRDILIERYTRAKSQFLGKFYDPMVGLTDAIHGRIKAVSDVGFICTSNHQHAYLRPESGMIFLRRSDRVLELIDQVARDLTQRGRISEPKAQVFAQQLVSAMIRPLVGAPPETRQGFFESAEYLHPLVQAQIGLFEALFEAGTETRARYGERLRFIADALRAVVASDDNAGEQKRYETIEAQLAATAGGAGA